jgi:hypothetical protein
MVAIRARFQQFGSHANKFCARPLGPLVPNSKLKGMPEIFPTVMWAGDVTYRRAVSIKAAVPIVKQGLGHVLR